MSLFPLSVFKRKKDAQVPLAMVALSDAPSAQIACDAGIDAILVGDSLGNTALGFDSTIPVTVDMMAHHVAAVLRGVRSSSRPDVPVIADMPFGSYSTIESAVQNAVRLMQLGAHAVKMEGLGEFRDFEFRGRSAFTALQSTGIPVMGHLGFTPQSQMTLGAVVQGKTHHDAQQLINDARSLEMEGCFAIVLEAMTEEVARKITKGRTVPTIGIGAGNGCDGQVLVWHDLIGISARSLKMARAYAQTRQIWTEALQEYKRDVESKAFPTEENSWKMAPEELEKWRKEGVIANYRGQEYRDGELTVEPFEGEPFAAFEEAGSGWVRDHPPFDTGYNDFDDRDPFDEE